MKDERPEGMDMNIIKRLVVLIISLTIPLSLSPVYGQPFWTEKSIYSDGEYLFAVGIATNVSNKEDGRIKAFDHGVREICKLKRVTKLHPKYVGAFIKRSQKLRQYKIKKGNKKVIRGYIEKKKYSLDTKRERLQLSRLSKKKSSSQIKANRLKNLQKARLVKKRRFNKQ
jgi:hypothetical protein